LWRLGAFAPADLDVGHAITAVAVVLVGPTVPWAALKQLRGALGVRISEQGISGRSARGRRTEIAWGDATRLEEPAFGTAVVHAGPHQVVVQTYLFAQRDELRRVLRERCPGVR
jgi:hypothetical protein